MEDKNSIKLTVIYESQWWVGILESLSNNTYSVAKHIFGAEPTEPEVFNFILHEYDNLRFTSPQASEMLNFRKKNPKRLIKEARQAQAKEVKLSKALDTLRIELEKNKKQRKEITSKMREEEKQRKFDLKQQKKKEKHRGH